METSGRSCTNIGTLLPRMSQYVMYEDLASVLKLDAMSTVVNHVFT
jgi:hypothetical protein